jgi:hypothetical protein
MMVFFRYTSLEKLSIIFNIFTDINIMDYKSLDISAEQLSGHLGHTEDRFYRSASNL